MEFDGLQLIMMDCEALDPDLLSFMTLLIWWLVVAPIMRCQDRSHRSTHALTHVEQPVRVSAIANESCAVPTVLRMSALTVQNNENSYEHHQLGFPPP